MGDNEHEKDRESESEREACYCRSEGGIFTLFPKGADQPLTGVG